MTNGIAESTASTSNASISSRELQHIKEHLLETEFRVNVFEQQVAERDKEIEILTNPLEGHGGEAEQGEN